MDRRYKYLSLIHIYEYEHNCRDNGYTVVAGVDEAGRGPLAGPVYAAAVILPNDIIIKGINDSKKLSEKKREELFEEITEKAIAYNIFSVDEKRIDEINILNATYEAMNGAVTVSYTHLDVYKRQVQIQIHGIISHL